MIPSTTLPLNISKIIEKQPGKAIHDKEETVWWGCKILKFQIFKNSMENLGAVLMLTMKAFTKIIKW